MADDSRFEWFADTMGVRAGEQVLELGPGSGASLTRIAARLGSGRIVGLERSATALAQAGRRCADEITAGRVRLVEGDIAKVRVARLLDELDQGNRFDLIFAVNVNLFWTAPATAAWSTMRESLAPTGRIWLCYGYGTPNSPTPPTAKLTERLTTAGYHCTTVTTDTLLAARATPNHQDQQATT
ncbi:class I SAM-dependent methyltransferase [Nocardia sp. IBHARD005]|uniref:class I SAM-dependent methyltransferase n=1 Tax=Nocardia sp. IBHARD005 TaxID=3457765 RepID=UPI004057E590